MRLVNRPLAFVLAAALIAAAVVIIADFAKTTDVLPANWIFSSDMDTTKAATMAEISLHALIRHQYHRSR